MLSTTLRPTIDRKGGIKRSYRSSERSRRREMASG